MAGNGLYDSKFNNKIIKWIDSRLPILSILKNNLADVPEPKNLTFAWNFGSIAGLGLIIQIVTGILLAMHYTPHANIAFDSVEHIMRDINYGWLIRYMHAVGASMFLGSVYIHIGRGMYYGSYKKPKEMLWFLGVLIFLIMMATAFMGYVLPWGQMSFWGATVITNLFSAFPVIGNSIVQLLWGGYSVDNPTLNRFFALHYLLPFVIIGIVILHIFALRVVGSSNPAGIEAKDKKDLIPFHPYYTIKDFFGFGVFLMIYCYFIFFQPNYLGHPDNYSVADPLNTPPHIVPEWYFLPFYAILRAIPSKLGGVIAMGSAILILFALPWLDYHPVRSGKYRPLFKKVFWFFILNFIFLGWLGAKPAEGLYILLARVGVLYYFGYFLLILPFLSKKEVANELPHSIDDYCKKELQKKELKKQRFLNFLKKLFPSLFIK